jgi:hypothetical protein
MEAKLSQVVTRRSNELVPVVFGKIIAALLHPNAA